MVHLIILAFGVCMALLCHWMIRHTFVDWDWEDFEDPASGDRIRKKVWCKKLSVPRWVYILLWLVCLLLVPLSFFAPIVLACHIAVECGDKNWHFQCESKAWKLLIRIKNWFVKEV